MPSRSTLKSKNFIALALALSILTATTAGVGSALAPEAAVAAARALKAAPPATETAPPGPYVPLRAAPEIGDGLGAGRGHEGVDLFAPIGTSLVAIGDGLVLEAGTDGSRGNYVSIFGPDSGHTYNYLHMLEPALVQRGDEVEAGQSVGRLGCSGSCYGAHLHLEVREGRGTYGPIADPVALLPTLEPAPGSGSQAKPAQ